MSHAHVRRIIKKAHEEKKEMLLWEMNSISHKQLVDILVKYLKTRVLDIFRLFKKKFFY